jgi:CDP-glycerol glycerophosphotransferase (TagB/SpsB family)
VTIGMSALREVIKYVKNPIPILPRLVKKVLSPISYLAAKFFVLLVGRERLNKRRNKVLFGAFGGRRYGDNSAAFFEYVISEYPEVDCYWVIREDSYRERRKRKDKPPVPPDRILLKDSFRANVMALIADIYVYSHGRYDVTDYPKIDVRGVFEVMLGHGITALKRTDMKTTVSGELIAVHSGDADLVVASSTMEAAIKITEWGIPEEKIVICGLPRHDRLLSRRGEARAERKRILYMPTWRSWNARRISMGKSGFFREIESFLKDPRLNECLKGNNIHIQLYVHMWMREFFEEFKKRLPLGGIEIVDQEDDLQDLILKSALLITDYSSVCWDYLLLDKPVLFYQFDVEEYLVHTGSYIDLKKNLFGPVARNVDEAVSWVRSLVETGFSTDPFRAEMERMKAFAFAYTDGKNRERLAMAISDRYPVNLKKALAPL